MNLEGEVVVLESGEVMFNLQRVRPPPGAEPDLEPQPWLPPRRPQPPHPLELRDMRGGHNIPTHTEDGIPIRKLYIANLPANTTRSELFNLFAHYGFIKSCWVKMGEKQQQNPRQGFAPAYAFITFSDTADAHKALVAPSHERILRGRTLRVSPADSWHQPTMDSDGTIRWRTNRTDVAETQENTTDVPEPTTSEAALKEQPDTEPEPDPEPEYNIMDILNNDCLAHIMSYVPLKDLIRSERVSMRWKNLIQDYFHGVRTFKTSWWEHNTITLTTAVLRHVLLRLGPSLVRLHINHHWNALNDRTAHTIGKFCPNLGELKIVGMNTKNWNPVIYGCKEIKSLAFVSCSRLTDTSLASTVGPNSSIESLTINTNAHITGIFLASMKDPKLHTIQFRNCESLQGLILSSSLKDLSMLKCLKLEMCPKNVWSHMPDILKHLTRLEELSLSGHMGTSYSEDLNNEICEAMGKLEDLKKLKLCRNYNVNNAIIKKVVECCKKLRVLDISACNSRKTISLSGITDDAMKAIGQCCSELVELNVSYLKGVTNRGLAAIAGCLQLRRLIARRCATITYQPLVKCVQACHQLEEVDVSECEEVTVELVDGCISAVNTRPRALKLWLAGTAVLDECELPSHELVTYDLDEVRNDGQFFDWMQMFSSESDSDAFSDDPDNDYDDLFSDGDDIYIDGDDYDFEDAMLRAEYGLNPDFLFI